MAIQKFYKKNLDFNKLLKFGKKFGNLENILKFEKNWKFEKKMEIWKEFGNSKKKLKEKFGNQRKK